MRESILYNRTLRSCNALFSFGRMINGAPAWRLFVFLVLPFFLLGCSQFHRGSIDEEKDPHFLEGKNRVKAMDWDGAIQSFERALQSNPQNASAHLELGILYDVKKNDFIDAMYHYQRHLTLRTNSPMADVVRQSITACTRELAKTVSYAVVTREVQRDLERLVQTNSLLKERVEFLQAELGRRPQYVTNYITNFVGVPQFDHKSSSRLTQPTQPISDMADNEEPAPAPTSDSSKPSASQKNVETPRTTPRLSPRATSQKSPPAAAVRPSRQASPTPSSSTGPAATRSVHTVRPGETLASLASRYGVPLKDLKAANPGAANGVRSGQKINIPAK